MSKPSDMLIDISERVDLTRAQMSQWEESLTAFSWIAPPFTSILYNMLNPDKGRMVATFLGPNKVPPWFLAGTNGRRLFFIAERFFQFDIMRRVFLMAHEVSHPMLGHIAASHYYRQRGRIELGFKSMPYFHSLANMAQDYVINDMLINSRIGTFVEGGCHDPRIGTFKDSWIDVYEKLLEEETNKERGRDKREPGENGRNGQKPFDFHLGLGQGEPDPKNPEEKLKGDEPITPQELEAEQQRAARAMAAAMELARAQGKLPAALEYQCTTVLEPVIDWNDHLKAQFARKLGTGTYDFQRPDRRLLVRDIIAPGRAGFRANIIVLGADSSGSIYDVPKLIERWMAECGGVMEDVKPREIHVVWCDAAIHRVDILSDPSDVEKMRNAGAKGGGGTSFVPVFEYCKTLEHDIDCMAYLTDGDGTFPDEAPDFPVIWGDISGNAGKYPFGDVVRIPVPRNLRG